MSTALDSKVTIIRRTEYDVERLAGQTPLNGRDNAISTTMDEVYDLEDPGHRKDLLEMMAMTVFENGDFNINVLDLFMDEVKTVIDEVITRVYGN